MNRTSRVCVGCMFLALLSLVPMSVMAQPAGGSAQAPAPAADAAATAAGQNTPPNPQALSQTGLLPVFAVDMNFDPAWVDGADAPTKSANYGHSGVNDSFQKAWEALKPAGFSAIRFALDLGDSHSAARLANLCIWAKANNVTLIPVLENTTASNVVGAFPAALVSLLRAGDGQQFAAYTQIAYFQVERSINIGRTRPKVNPAEAEKALLSSIDAVRKSELQALNGTSVQATPIMVSVSFDYELVKQGAIAGVPLDPGAEQKAQAAVKKAISPFAANANVDAVEVVWFPRSISSGDEGHFALLLRELQTAVPDKQVVLSTGISSAFNATDQQNQFLTVTLTNLWDFRLSSGGTSSHFQGVIFEQALQGSKADLPAPVGSGEPGQWNWNEKAQKLAQLWSEGKPSAEVQWWLNKVEASRGLLAAQSDATGGTNFVPLPGLQTLQGIATTFAQASQNMPPASPVGMTTSSQPAPVAGAVATPAGVDPGGAVNASAPAAAGAQVKGANSPGPYQQLLLTLVQQVVPQITTALITKMTTGRSGGSIPPQYPAYPGQNAAAPMPGQNPDGTLNPGANPPMYQPGSGPGYPAQGTTASAAGAVSVGPQDVSVDAASAVPGQTVRITVQIHNMRPDLDLSGLTVQLVDPTNPVASAQNMQSGISVARSATAPVQLTWIASQSASNPYQLSLQILDATGAPLASAPVPAISNMNPAGINSGLASNPPPGNTFANSSNGTVATNSSPGVMPLNSPGGNVPTGSSTGGTPTNGVNSTPAGQTGTGSSGQAGPDGTGSGPPASAVAPVIVYFGLAGVPGQPSTFLVQIGNQSPALMPSVQAQIYVDGQPGQVVQIGAVLPQQSRSAVFDQSPITAGSQTIKVVVTSGTTSATATAAARLKHTSDHARSGPVENPRPVRSGRLGQYSIGAITTPSSGNPGPAGGLQSDPAPSPLPGQAPSPLVNTQPGSASQSAAGSPASQTVATTGTAGSNSPGQTTGGQQGSSAAAQAQVGSSVQPSGATASTPVAKTLQAPGSGLPALATQGPGATAPPAIRNTRTIQPSGMTPSNQIARTIQPPGSAANQVNGGVQGSGASPSAPTVRTIQPPGVTPPTQIARTILPPGSVPINQTNGGVQASGTSPSAPTVRTIQPPGTTPSSQTARTVQPPGSMPANLASSAAHGQSYLDLSVSPGEVQVKPGSQPGQVVVTALVRNTGTLGTGGASVMFQLVAGGRPVAMSRPMAFSIPGSGAYLASWTTSVAPGQSLQLVVSVRAAGDVNPANNQASVSFTTPQSVQVRR